MANFPYDVHHNFEDGQLDAGDWDAQTDSENKLENAHYSELAAMGNLRGAPYRGAWCMRINLALGTAAAFVQEDSVDITLATEDMWLSFALFVSSGLVMANNDTFDLVLFRSASADENTISLRFTTASGFQLGTGDAGGTVVYGGGLTLDKWLQVELNYIPATGGAGVSTLYLDGGQIATDADMTDIAIVSARFGAMNMDSGTTAGIVLMDDIRIALGLVPQTRITPYRQRFPETLLLEKSGHAFVGSGKICNASLLSGGAADNVMSIYDTDVASVVDSGNKVVELRNTVSNELVDPAGMPVHVTRGAYVELTGTDPRALIKIGYAKGYGSDGAVRTVGSRYSRHFSTELVAE